MLSIFQVPLLENCSLSTDETLIKSFRVFGKPPKIRTPPSIFVCFKPPWVALRQEGGFWRPEWILLLSVLHRQGQLVTPVA